MNITPTSVVSEIEGAPRRPAGKAGRAAGLLLLGVAGFQAALALGAPWGAAAWGGANPGTLPAELRVGSAMAIVVYAGIGGLAVGAFGSGRWARRGLRGASVLMALGAVANAASPSMVEKLLWTPVTLALAVLLWRAARDLEGPTG